MKKLNSFFVLLAILVAVLISVLPSCTKTETVYVDKVVYKDTGSIKVISDPGDQKKIDSLQHLLDQLRADQNGNQTKIDSLQAIIDSLKNKGNADATQIAALQAQIDSLNGVIASLRQQIVDLQTQIAAASRVIDWYGMMAFITDQGTGQIFFSFNWAVFNDEDGEITDVQAVDALYTYYFPDDVTNVLTGTIKNADIRFHRKYAFAAQGVYSAGTMYTFRSDITQAFRDGAILYTTQFYIKYKLNGTQRQTVVIVTYIPGVTGFWNFQKPNLMMRINGTINASDYLRQQQRRISSDPMLQKISSKLMRLD